MPRAHYLDRPLTIRLTAPMLEELHRAAREASQEPGGGHVTIQQFAQECVESVLATRRLEAMAEAGLAPGDRRQWHPSESLLDERQIKIDTRRRA